LEILIPAIAAIISSSNQRQAASEARKAAQAQAKAREAELQMQIAAIQEQSEAQKQMLKQIAIYGGALLGGLMLIRGLTR
jgi:hypothetical protein